MRSFDIEFWSTVGGLAAGGGFAVTIGGGIYTLFDEQLTAEAAIAVSIISVVLFVVVVLTVDNKRRIDRMESEQ